MPAFMLSEYLILSYLLHFQRISSGLTPKRQTESNDDLHVFVIFKWVFIENSMFMYVVIALVKNQTPAMQSVCECRG